MDREITSTDAMIEYERPAVFDYGDLAEQTQTSSTSGSTDVPIHTVGEKVFSPVK